MLVKEIITFLNNKFPVELQEAYDNAGEQVSFPEAPVRGILISLDINSDIVAEADKLGCNMIITHHPFIFSPIKKIIAGDSKSDLLVRLIDTRKSLFSLHTNLDKIYYNKLARVIGISTGEPLFREDDKGRTGKFSDIGFGVYGEINKPMLFENFIELVKEKLELEFLLFSGDKKKNIKKVVALNGAGGRLIEKIIDDKKPDCIITGDVGFHQSHNALLHDVAIIDAGHYGTEKILLNFLYKELQAFVSESFSGPDIIQISTTEKSPFEVFV